MSPASGDLTAAACRYLLVGLLQRLDRIQPGLILEMREGVLADRNATEGQEGVPAEVPATFAEALRILDLASAV